ncbi:carbohydrate-binding family 9-like protein [Prevotella sp. OH937_COT-195]|uniref:carbohydrate-binding family 9-like protein n=1 Tax=Prevotella sp. OH937_COT-195 TaxID=2491051 RepID=UPI000F64D78C|nr:carbohydrate-binding family 9-like protein [Prevotella sp. OH937_COT-195]RRC97293.1 hypothetical protein EII32_10570 [Prevotella sp. OH937_COT-195]
MNYILKITIMTMAVMSIALTMAKAANAKNSTKALTIKRLPHAIEEAKEVGKTFDRFGVPWNDIDCQNWKHTYPYKPTARFRIAHDGNNIYIEYSVKEDAVRAVNAKDQTAVFQDACCEFFLKLNNDNVYYNIESNCIGAILMQVGETATDREEADDDVLGSIGRWSSLGRKPFETRIGEQQWTLMLAIPVSALFKSNVKNLDGVEATANFFKYGSRLPKRHFLSWNMVGQDGKPNFHRTNRFGKIMFEGKNNHKNITVHQVTDNE